MGSQVEEDDKIEEIMKEFDKLVWNDTKNDVKMMEYFLRSFLLSYRKSIEEEDRLTSLYQNQIQTLRQLKSSPL